MKTAAKNAIIMSSLCITTIAMAGAPQFNSTTGNQTGSDKVTSSCYINQQRHHNVYWDVFNVPKNAPYDYGGLESRLSPRAERGLSRNGYGQITGNATTQQTKVIRMTGECQIMEAYHTTIAQLYNWDDGAPDKGRPYFMVECLYRSNGWWLMEDRESPSASSYRYWVYQWSPFTFDYRSNNRKAMVYVYQNGVTRHYRTWWIPSSRWKEGWRDRIGKTYFRFGAYHHGQTTARAEIRYRNTWSSGWSVQAGTGI